MKQTKLLLIFFAAYFFCAQAQAESYLDVDAISPTLISRPLKVGSAEWKKEIEEILVLQKNADKEEIKEAEKQYHYSLEKLLKSVDEELTREDFPQTYELLDNVYDTSKSVNEEVKEYWNTKRPYQMDSRVKALIKTHSNPSYPSGHTCGAYTTARVMALLFPEKRDEFFASAEKIAQHRVLVGMHFPHDIRGGKELSLLIVGALLQNEEFLEDLADAKEELK